MAVKTYAGAQARRAQAGGLARRGAWAIAILALLLVLAFGACARGGAGGAHDGGGGTGGTTGGTTSSSAATDALIQADGQLDASIAALDGAYTDANVDLSAQDNESQAP